MEDFQQDVGQWAIECFGEEIAKDKRERCLRFLEEAAELVQCLGLTEDEANRVILYVFGRNVGEKKQEVGGVMVTLAALCAATDIDLTRAAYDEASRCWQVIDKIREKNKTKPSFKGA